LAIFILSRACILTYILVHPTMHQNKTYYIALITALVLYCLLSYLVLKHRKVAIWTMIIVLTLYGLQSLFIGLIASLSQYVLKPYGIVFGLYWMYGAFSLYSFVNGLVKKASIN
jgi:hypothetical protein